MLGALSNGLREPRKVSRKGTGPSFSIVNGRAVYSTEALDEWLEGHLSRRGPGAKRFPAAVRPLAA